MRWEFLDSEGFPTLRLVGEGGRRAELWHGTSHFHFDRYRENGDLLDSAHVEIAHVALLITRAEKLLEISPSLLVMLLLDEPTYHNE